MNQDYSEILEELRKEYIFIHENYPRNGKVGKNLAYNLLGSLFRAEDILVELIDLRDEGKESLLQGAVDYVRFRQDEIIDMSNNRKVA